MGNCIPKRPREITITDPADIDQFLTRIRPLDLLVFRGGEGVSKIITKLEKIKTGSDEISHVEVAISRKWCRDILKLNVTTDVEDTDDTLLSWGSTLSGSLNDGVYNGETGGVTFGVQVRVLRDLVTEYIKCPGANVGICRLIDNPIDQRDNETKQDYALRVEKLKNDISDAYKIYQGCAYETSPISLLAALFPVMRGWRNATEDLLGQVFDVNKWLFCSEFVAVLYKHIGVINDATDGVIDGKTIDPRDILPVDFIGVDADNVLAVPICEIPPVWVKK